MRVLRLVPVFVLFLLLGGQVLLVALPAYAVKRHCCMCGTCDHNACVYCPGEGDCAWCAAGDSETFSSYGPSDDGMVEIGNIPEPLSSTVMKLNVTERLMELTRGGKRIYGNFTLKLLDSADRLKFRCPGPDEKNMGNTLLQFVRSYSSSAKVKEVK